MKKKQLFLQAAALLFAGCGSNHAPVQSFAGLSRVSGQSPFPADCVVAGQRGTNFRGAEVEPFVAIDPTDPKHLIGVWQQDRWSNGGSNGIGSGVSFDGGNTWTTGFAAFTLCSGGTAAKGTNFQRASDPWITFAADGTPHQIGFAFNGTSARTAMLAVHSTDGGRSWTDPVFLTEVNDPDLAIDKESITADPGNANYVYAIWDRLTGVQTAASNGNTGPAWFTRTTDGGLHWEEARIIYDPGLNSQTISNQIVVLPGSGTLVDLLTIVEQINSVNSPATVSVLRSADKGVTWSQPVSVAVQRSVAVFDPKSNTTVRSGDIVPDIAVDPVSGALYIVWEDSRFSSDARDGIALSRSLDGGLTWSAPVRVNGNIQTQAFTPAVAVAAGGKVGVTYYDLSNNNPGDTSRLLATAWLAVSTDGGNTFQESAISGPFDIRSAAHTQEGYFIGDYQGLVASGASFVPFFAIANNGNTSNPSDIFAHPPGAGQVATEFAGTGFTVPRVPRTGLRRSF